MNRYFYLLYFLIFARFFCIYPISLYICNRITKNRNIIMGNEKKIVRPREGRNIAGVCAAFANFFGLDVSIIRIVWLLAVLLAGTGMLAYLICWLVIPKEGC